MNNETLKEINRGALELVASLLDSETLDAASAAFKLSRVFDSLSQINRELSTIENFDFGDIVIDENDDSGGCYVVVQIQPENGRNGTVVCYSEFSFAAANVYTDRPQQPWIGTLTETLVCFSPEDLRKVEE